MNLLLLWMSICAVIYAQPGVDSFAFRTDNPKHTSFDKKADSILSLFSENKNTAGLVAGMVNNNKTNVYRYTKTTGIISSIPRLSKAIRLTHQSTFANGNNRIGMGWHFFNVKGKEYLAQKEQTAGFCNIVIFDKQAQHAVAILTNASVSPGKTAIDLIQWLDNG